MSTLLSPTADMADEMLCNDSTAEDESEEIIVRRYNIFKWTYMNLCIYGIQVQRVTKRYCRRATKALRPLVLILAIAVALIAAPLRAAGESFSAIGKDLKKAFSHLKSARRLYGKKASAGVFTRNISRGFTRYRGFLMSVCNHVLPVISIAALIITGVNLFSRNYALEVVCDGVTVGVISDESTYIEASEMIGERVVTSNENFKAALQPTYVLVPADETKLNNADEICETFLQQSEDVDEGYGFFVNDKLVGAIKSEGDMDVILEGFKDQYLTGAESEQVSFVGDIKIEPGLYDSEKILSSGEFKEAIGQTEKVSKLYTVSKNPKLEKILDAYDMTEERFAELNEGFEGTLAEGATVVVEKDMPVLTVKNLVTSQYTTPIAFQTVNEEDPAKFVGDKSLKQKGVNGEKLITLQITYVDGVETSRDIINTEVLYEPVDEVYLVGSKKPTTQQAKSGGKGWVQTADGGGTVDNSGSWTWPVPNVHVVSSPFGMRRGRLHSGIDIANGHTFGETIVATKAGTVTMVKNQSGGYGLHLTIDHGNGYSSLYAHCSTVLVSAGQQVSKGQPIAKVGSTGSSTGPHLHFEIRYHGSAQNPQNYVSK